MLLDNEQLPSAGFLTAVAGWVGTELSGRPEVPTGVVHSFGDVGIRL